MKANTNQTNRIYLCIDLKSFYASVECVARGLDPMTTRLVVADPKRKSGTICLAVSPALKALGVKNRCRVFEIPSNLSYIMATPRMQLYIDCSTEIYGIYLKYIAKEDIHVYSIDEAFLDITDYLSLYQTTPKGLANLLLTDIQNTLGLPAACGIGTNLYLSKIALDLTAKHSPDRIGYLDEDLYQKTLWNHKPLTDFWRIGPGIAKRLASIGILTMKDIAIADEDLLYRTFGVDARYLIDHAWGTESVTISQIKSYEPKEHSISSGQVLMRDYSFEEGLLIVKEMTDSLCLSLVDQHLVTDSVSLYVRYAKRELPSVRGTASITATTSSPTILIEEAGQLYRRIVNPKVPIRRVTVTFPHVKDEVLEQWDLFHSPAELEKERRLLQAVLSIKKRFGKNAILKGMNLENASTAKERNHQIGGHSSGI